MMKNQIAILVIFSFFLALIPSVSHAQETTKEKTKVIEELQKKAEAEKKAQEELMIGRSSVAAARYGVVSTENAIRDASFAYQAAIDNLDDLYVVGGNGAQWIYGGSQNSTTLEFSKLVKEATFSKDFPAEVDSDARRASISVSGSCRSGEIRIKITMPSGKVYTEILIDEFGSVNWTKTFTLSEEKKDEKAGTWKFLITGKEATGNFRVSVRSN